MQAVAVANVDRVQKTAAKCDGARFCDMGDLEEGHRTPTAKGDRGGWNGPAPIIKGLPGRGVVAIKSACQRFNVNDGVAAADI